MPNVILALSLLWTNQPLEGLGLTQSFHQLPQLPSSILWRRLSQLIQLKTSWLSMMLWYERESFVEEPKLAQLVHYEARMLPNLDKQQLLRILARLYRIIGIAYVSRSIDAIILNFSFWWWETSYLVFGSCVESLLLSSPNYSWTVASGLACSTSRRCRQGLFNCFAGLLLILGVPILALLPLSFTWLFEFMVAICIFYILILEMNSILILLAPQDINWARFQLVRGFPSRITLLVVPDV